LTERGFSIGTFKEQDWRGNAEKDQHADERDGWDRSDAFRVHQRDEDGDACEYSERPHGEQGTPEESRVWMRNRFTHHLVQTTQSVNFWECWPHPCGQG
jgi:hypothetical protein